MTSSAVRILSVVIADSQPLFVEGLQQVLSTGNSWYRFDLRGATHCLSEAEALLHQQRPDLIFLDMMLLGTEVAQAVQSVRKGHPYGRIVVFTYNDDVRLVKAALRGGADGVLLKSIALPDLYHAIGEVFSGKVYTSPGLTLNEQIAGQGMDPTLPEARFARKYGFTRREMEILPYIAQVMSNKEIAEQLYISDQTVSVHRKNIMRKLKVNSTAGIVKIAFENHLL